MPKHKKIIIDTLLVQQLISTQFPQWAGLPIAPVQFSGWDNRTFHLGQDMLVRLPSSQEYLEQVLKEQFWLPKLAPHLPLPIPIPLALGKPGEGYPWSWSVYRWIEGETAAVDRIDDLSQFAIELAQFLVALQHCDNQNGPVAGAHNFYRGGPLSIYDAQTKQAINLLGQQINPEAVLRVWESALDSSWHCEPVWIHGDVAAGNLLVKKGVLHAVIDFGCLGIGDPACDLAIAWTFFKNESRKAFRTALCLDDDTWARGRGWALWKALIICAGLVAADDLETEKSWMTIDQVTLT